MGGDQEICGNTKKVTGRILRMADYKFNLNDRVRRIGQQEVRTVVQRADDPRGTRYYLQLGRDGASGQWAFEQDLELVEAYKPPDSGPGFVPSRSIMD